MDFELQEQGFTVVGGTLNRWLYSPSAHIYIHTDTWELREVYVNAET